MMERFVSIFAKETMDPTMARPAIPEKIPHEREKPAHPLQPEPRREPVPTGPAREPASPSTRPQPVPAGV